MRFKALVLDFDGTMCLLFKNFDLNETVRTLHTAMKKRGVAYSPEDDAFNVFDAIARQTENDLHRLRAFGEADKILTDAEMQAVDSCEIVPGLAEAIRFLYNKGISIGVASNNSGACIEKLTGRLCPDIPIAVTGRIGEKPQLMKPNPWSLRETVARMKCREESVFFVGDSKRDYLCADGTRCCFIGMAPTERKRERLLQFLPGGRIVSDYYDLQKYLTDKF